MPVAEPLTRIPVHEDDWGGLRVVGVAYTTTADTISAIVLDGDDRRVVPLVPTGDVLPRIDLLRDELRDPMAIARGRVPQLDRFATDWGRRLLPPDVLDEPPDAVVFFPHGAVHDLPLHLVSGPDEPLGLHTAVSYASSWSLFARCLTANPARAMPDPQGAGLRALVVGKDVLAAGPDRFAELAGSIAASLGVDPVNADGEAATSRSRLKFKLRNAGPTHLLCLVTHGVVDPADHRLSGLLLSGGNYAYRSAGAVFADPALARRRPTAFYADLPFQSLPNPTGDTPSEVLTIMELEYEGNLHTDLVILVGCSAGLGERLVGDRPASVAETFLDLGAASVLAPLWDIDYTVAEEWIGHFLDAWLRRGQPKTLAAREAARALFAAGFGLERVGAFTLRGDWL
jgi:CHAT domain-containing protein